MVAGRSGTRRSRQLVTWYAPEARQFVKAEGFDLDLLAFQVVALDQPALSVAPGGPSGSRTTSARHHPGNRGGRQGEWRQGGDLGQRHPQRHGGL